MYLLEKALNNLDSNDTTLIIDKLIQGEVQRRLTLMTANKSLYAYDVVEQL
jgi:hypothetical protein